MQISDYVILIKEQNTLKITCWGMWVFGIDMGVIIGQNVVDLDRTRQRQRKNLREFMASKAEVATGNL